MKALKDEARETTNMLKQTVGALKQSLFRKESMVEDLLRAERDRDLAAEGVRMQMESASASAAAAERQLAAARQHLDTAKVT
jgi:kinesin family protein C1